jgi:hypothetical protein
MTQIHESRKSSSPYIETVWKSQNVTDGTYLATPDGSWDLIVLISETGKRQMMLAGQATKSSYIPYRAGTGSVVISFALGAYMPHLPGDKMVDLVEILPNFDDDHFSLAGHTFALPTFETAEELVEHMVKTGLLKNDGVVDGALNGTPKAISSRGAQRHFVHTTGMSQKRLTQIKRAQEAVTLLKQGKKPSEAAADAGYSDQPHLAKSLKQIMDSTPGNVDDIHKL